MGEIAKGFCKLFLMTPLSSSSYSPSYFGEAYEKRLKKLTTFCWTIQQCMQHGSANGKDINNQQSQSLLHLLLEDDRSEIEKDYGIFFDVAVVELKDMWWKIVSDEKENEQAKEAEARKKEEL